MPSSRAQARTQFITQSPMPNVCCSVSPPLIRYDNSSINAVSINTRRLECSQTQKSDEIGGSRLNRIEQLREPAVVPRGPPRIGPRC